MAGLLFTVAIEVVTVLLISPQEHDVERLERMQEQLKKATAMLGEALGREG